MWVSPVMDEEAPADFEAAEAEPGDELPSTLQFAQREKSSRNTQFHIFLFVRGVRSELEVRSRPIHTRGWIIQMKPRQ